MDKKFILNKGVRFLKSIYLKLFRINDSPIKIALGFAVGVFLGIMPGVGPLAALLFAYILRINRASALLGSLLTNTWVSVIAFLLSIKVGASVLGLNYNDVYKNWHSVLKEFHWDSLFQLSFYQIILPVLVGYLMISLCLGILAFAIMYVIAVRIKNRKLKLKQRNSS